MKPSEIKAELAKKEIAITSIARTAGVSVSSISQVVNRRATSKRLKAAIAAAINRQVDEVFPE